MIERCETYFSSLDSLVGELVDAAGPDATVVLASDHGFGPTRDVFHVNSWLEREGYLSWADDQAAETNGDATKVGFAEMTRHVHALDWTRTLAFCATPSSQGINIVEGVADAERARLQHDLRERLLDIRRPADGRRLVEEVWTRDEAFPGPFGQLGPDLSMVLADGGTMSILPSETVVARREEVRGHHRWEGIFVAAGPGIRPGATADELSIVDIAPLVLHQLGLPVPEDMAGRLPVEIFDAEELQRRPPRRAPASPAAPAVGPAGVELEPEEEASVMERLRALGYVE